MEGGWLKLPAPAQDTWYKNRLCAGACTNACTNACTHPHTHTHTRPALKEECVKLDKSRSSGIIGKAVFGCPLSSL